MGGFYSLVNLNIFIKATGLNLSKEATKAATLTLSRCKLIVETGLRSVNICIKRYLSQSQVCGPDQYCHLIIRFLSELSFYTWEHKAVAVQSSARVGMKQ